MTDLSLTDQVLPVPFMVAVVGPPGPPRTVPPVQLIGEEGPWEPSHDEL